MLTWFAVAVLAASPTPVADGACDRPEYHRYHANLDDGRYRVPEVERIVAHYREELLRSLKGEAASVALVAEIADDVVGFVDARIERSPDLMHRDLAYCHVSEIAVSSQHQRRGIGRRLLRAAEEWGRQHGAVLASLERHVANSHAAAFYVGPMGYSAAAAVLIKRLQPA